MATQSKFPFAILLVAIMAAACISFHCDTNGRTEKTNGPTRKIYASNEFSRLVMLKSTDEIIKLLGKPDRTSDGGSAGSWWTYERITKDQYSGNINKYVQLTIKNDTVVSVITPY